MAGFHITCGVNQWKVGDEIKKIGHFNGSFIKFEESSTGFKKILDGKHCQETIFPFIS